MLQTNFSAPPCRVFASVEDPPPLVTSPRGVDRGHKHLDTLLAQRLGRQVGQVLLGADLDDVDESVVGENRREGEWRLMRRV